MGLKSRILLLKFHEPFATAATYCEIYIHMYVYIPFHPLGCVTPWKAIRSVRARSHSTICYRKTTYIRAFESACATSRNQTMCGLGTMQPEPFRMGHPLPSYLCRYVGMYVLIQIYSTFDLHGEIYTCWTTTKAAGNSASNGKALVTRHVRMYSLTSTLNGLIVRNDYEIRIYTAQYDNYKRPVWFV